MKNETRCISSLESRCSPHLQIEAFASLQTIFMPSEVFVGLLVKQLLPLHRYIFCSINCRFKDDKTRSWATIDKPEHPMWNNFCDIQSEICESTDVHLSMYSKLRPLAFQRSRQHFVLAHDAPQITFRSCSKNLFLIVIIIFMKCVCLSPPHPSPSLHLVWYVHTRNTFGVIRENKAKGNQGGCQM